MVECAHDDFEFSFNAQELSPGIAVVAAQVRCASCQQQFHWRGLDVGSPNAELPVTSADGYELRAPIAFGPGSVVKLFEATGLLDRLQNPAEEAPSPPEA